MEWLREVEKIVNKKLSEGEEVDIWEELENTAEKYNIEPLDEETFYDLPANAKIAVVKAVLQPESDEEALNAKWEDVEYWSNYWDSNIDGSDGGCGFWIQGNNIYLVVGQYYKAIWPSPPAYTFKAVYITSF